MKRFGQAVARVRASLLEFLSIELLLCAWVFGTALTPQQPGP